MGIAKRDAMSEALSVSCTSHSDQWGLVLSAGGNFTHDTGHSALTLFYTNIAFLNTRSIELNTIFFGYFFSAIYCVVIFRSGNILYIFSRPRNNRKWGPPLFL